MFGEPVFGKDVFVKFCYLTCDSISGFFDTQYSVVGVIGFSYCMICFLGSMRGKLNCILSQGGNVEEKKDDFTYQT